MKLWLSRVCMVLLAVACNRGEPESTNRRSPEANDPSTMEANAVVSNPLRSGGHSKAEVDALFTNATLLQIDLVIPRAGMSVLRSTRWGNGVNRPVAKATVREAGNTYANVAVHLKGSAGSFRSIDDKPAFTLNFDKFTSNQNFHGLHKISLNNSVQDSSFLCEKLAREIFLAAGVPVPRAAHALVRLNGRDLGLYVMLEGANKQFLKRYFSNPSGNLYDGGFCQDISTSLQVNCGENPRNNSGLKALVSAVHQRADYARLKRVLDTDRFLAMVALEVMLSHWDGYSMNVNNWRIFHDLESNRMVFIPHGLDQLFGAGGQFHPGNALLPQNVRGQVTAAVLASDEGQARYRQIFAQVFTNVFRPDDILTRVDVIAAGLQTALADTHPDLATQIQQHAVSLKHRIRRRADVLNRQLAPPTPPAEFTKDNSLRLSGWSPYLGAGRPTLTQLSVPEGVSVLAINAGDALSSSSWRTHLLLRAGRYQFEGRLKLNGVAVDPNDKVAGADLRISKGSPPKKLSGTLDWLPCRYPFSLTQDGEVEFVCELRALKGEAWFDPASLRLVRLP